MRNLDNLKPSAGTSSAYKASQLINIRYFLNGILFILSGTSYFIVLRNRRQTQRGEAKNAVVGNITEWSGLGYVAATRKTQDRNY